MGLLIVHFGRDSHPISLVRLSFGRYARRRVNRTLTDLRAQLGAPSRFQIDAEPARRKRPVVTSVLWRCGCSAEGTALTSLALAPCREHRTERTRFHGVRVLGSLLTRP
jgi:hypothetical protein